MCIRDRSRPMAQADELLRLAAALRAEARPDLTFMEVCGTHTMSIARYGLRELLPDSMRLVSGPGCPVCVTAMADLDRVVALARLPQTTLATFCLLYTSDAADDLTRVDLGG